MLCLIPDETPVGKFHKRHVDPKNIYTINRHLLDQRESHMAEDEKLTTADDIKIDVPPEKEDAVRNMLLNYENSWSGQLGEIKATELRIYLKPDAKLFKSFPYRAIRKIRELEKSEINKQFTAGVIYPALSEWAAMLLFAPKKDRRLRFCIDYRQLNSMTVKDTYPLPRMGE